MNCSGCAHWLVEQSTSYQDGSVVVAYKAPDGMGRCNVLDVETAAAFGCNQFAAGGPLVETTSKAGAPWMHSVAGPCPDCGGLGLGCVRCAGTGKVRHYEDGHVGEEQTRLHPKEKELAATKRQEHDTATTIAADREGKSSIMEQA